MEEIRGTVEATNMIYLTIGTSFVFGVVLGIALGVYIMEEAHDARG